MNVFVTGASGYIGSAVAGALAGHGHRVIGLVRSEEAAAALRARGQEPVLGNLHAPESFIVAAQQADGIIHAGMSDDANASLIDGVVVTALLNLIEGSGKPFLYTSGVWVMGATDGKTLDEEAPLNPAPVVAWRPAVEDLVLEAAGRGVRGVVIRPAIVYGKGGGLIAPMVKAAATGVVRFLGDGKNHWSSVHVDDLAELYVLALEKAPAGSIYIAAQGAPVRTADLASAIAAAAGESVTTTSWPVEEASLVYGPAIAGMLLDQHVSAARAKRELGWEPRQLSLLDEIRKGSYASAR